MMKYNILFYYSQDDRSFVTVVPKLPGCMSDGNTIEEALKNTQAIIEDWIQDAQEDGETVPEPDSSDLELSGCTAQDVSGYILHKTGSITAMMLEKLVYYTLAWSIAWYKKPLVRERFQAWRHGLVCPNLFDVHRGRKIVSSSLFPDTHSFSPTEQFIVDSVIETYGSYDAEWLSQLTHLEAPWLSTRGQLPDDERSHCIISEKAMLDYYGRIAQ